MMKKLVLSLRLAFVSLPLFFLAGCTVNPKSSSTTTTTSSTPVSLTATSLPYGVLGAAYGASLSASNGSQPYMYSITAGALPAGLTLSTVGRINGTPKVAGVSSFVIEVTDSSSPAVTASAALTLTIAGPLVLTSGTLANAMVNTAYSGALPIAGGVAPYVVTLTSGMVPGGLTLSNAGAVSGTPLTYGSTTLGVLVQDSSNPRQSASGTITLVINPAPLVFSYPATTATTPGTAATVTPSTLGGTAPVTYALTTGTLPVGMTLSATTGTVSGMPTTAGSYSFSVTATDSTVPAQTVAANTTVNVLNAFVSVNTTTALAVVPATGFGIHTSVYDPSLSDITALPALLTTAGIQMLRYPGGSYSDNYHWAQYTMTPFFASSTPACNVASNGYLAPGTDFGSFLKTLAATGTQAIITVNYGTSLADANGTKSTGAYGASTCSEPSTGGQPQEAAAWVAYANGDPGNTQTIGIDAVGFDWKTVGFWAGLRAATPLATDDGYNFLRLGLFVPIGITYWELGNEIYYNGYNSNNNAETDDHAPYVYSAGYSGTYDSRANITGISPTTYGTNAVTYIQAMRAVDPTIKIGVVVSSAIDPIPSTWTPAVLSAVCGSATLDFAILHYYPGTYNATTAAQLLSSPQNDMPMIVAGIKSNLAAACPATASAIQIFETETNPDGTLATSVQAAVPGLYATHEFLTGLENGIANIDWLELHAGAGTFLTPLTEAPGPAYYGIQMAHLLAGVGDTLVATTSSSTTLIAHATSKANGQKGVLLLNADPTNSATTQVTVTGATLGANAAEYSFGISTTQSGSALTATALSLPGNIFTITVPPYTAVELIIP